MHIPKNFFHDRLILLLLTSSAFAAILNAILILLRLDSSRGTYIVQYRANLGISAYRPGDSTTFLTFVLFGFVIFAAQLFLSMRAYQIKRAYAVVISALSLLLILLAIIVSNSLLALR
jgi:hypothetical protein